VEACTSCCAARTRIRPDQEQLGKRAGAKRKVRRLLDVRLAWMRGYPCEAGPENAVRLRPWPRAGHAVDATEPAVTPLDLSKAVTLRSKLIREFPRALPAVVGDKRRWNARMEASLATLKGLLAGK
jgi:hypothetical protein